MSTRNVLKTLAATALMAAPTTALATDGASATSGRDAWLADRTRILDATEVDLGEFKWVARPVVVFADSALDPAFQQQIDLLQERPDELVERDVVIITDTDPSERSDIRTQLRPRGFMLTLIGKDGRVNLRKPFPWDVRELSRSIDKMPIRRQEIRDSNRGGR